MAKDDRRAVVTSTSKEGTYEHIVGERLLEGGASTGPGLLGFALGEKRLGVISAHVVVRLWLEVPRTHLVVCTRGHPPVLQRLSLHFGSGRVVLKDKQQITPASWEKAP
ncbi:hypothetical protein PCH_Pc21g13660 [Penicillium rubens Wisconsin 54-1255]|uniref:Uncharacterized protein n=1 Tax=Penicillium rubens (strain ATCC 28089 / DSM 1075 / NRRL 1951 / Wisconsin 54-1255) TaxID=500485 RepID=B6HNB6_PENRW|nr:hypothetical protein PCH_Pc21g13660 [Penicillium rubens Wisconsin 54-1255]